MTISDRSMTHVMVPVRYEPGVERLQPDEREGLEELSRIFRDVQENVLRREGEARHGTHAKATALLKGTLEIPDDLPPGLAQVVRAAWPARGARPLRAGAQRQHLRQGVRPARSVDQSAGRRGTPRRRQPRDDDAGLGAWSL